jgi:hypothetical protein
MVKYLHIYSYIRKPFPSSGRFSFSFLTVQILLPGTMADDTVLLYTQVQYQKGSGGSYVEKPANMYSD